MTAPCKDCAERRRNCHSTCVKYAGYRAELSALKAEKKKQTTVHGYEYQKTLAIMRNKRQKKYYNNRDRHT